MQFHVLSFEGPDDYVREEKRETRASGLLRALTSIGHETHLWFIGDLELPEYDIREGCHLHRWHQGRRDCNPNSKYEEVLAQNNDFRSSLPSYIFDRYLRPCLLHGSQAVVIAEDWQTVDAVTHLDWRLRKAGLRPLVDIIWNANNTFGFDQIDWDQLTKAATITTVSRFIKLQMQELGIDAIVIPNGLSPDAYDQPDRNVVARFRRALVGRTVITKTARWNPDRRWLDSVAIVRALKDRGYRPLFIAHGGTEPYGEEVIGAMNQAGLAVENRTNGESSFRDLVSTIGNTRDIDVINIQSSVSPESRRALFRASDIVLANSSHEPFGYVGLEAMAVGGVAFTGCSGEDYADSGKNAIVMRTGEPREFLGLYRSLIDNPKRISAMRRSGRTTAKYYSWYEIVRREYLPRLDFVPAMCA